jgi:hypothetical protein
MAALAAALPAAGKDGVKATFATTIPRDAEPGTKLEVAWRLASIDEHGQAQPFGGSGVFVRLLSASGAGAQIAYADEHATGDYTATVVVPQGGIGKVEVGIRGWTSGAGGTHRADALFPIANDPLAPAAGGGSAGWIYAAVAALVLALSGLAVLIGRRRISLAQTDIGSTT